MTGVLVQRGRLDTDRDAEEKGPREWSEASRSHRKPRVAGGSHKLLAARKAFSLEPAGSRALLTP